MQSGRHRSVVGKIFFKIRNANNLRAFISYCVALYGVLFPQDEEPSFSNYRLWESLGFIIAYIFSNVLCVNVKLYILLAVIACGMVGYFIIEFLERRRKKCVVE